MANQVLATVHLPYTTNLPEDEAVNTFAFNFTGTGQATTEVADAVLGFYEDVQTSASLGGYISEVVSRATNACRVDLAEIVDAGPDVDIGPVYASYDFTLNAAGAGETPVSLPLECAIVSSFYNTTATSVTIRRRRGRIYLGPLDLVVLDQSGPYPYVKGLVLDDMVQAAEAMQVEAASGGAEWCVWSRTAGVLYPVDSGFVDNELDTQRRRGADATNRETWTVVP